LGFCHRDDFETIIMAVQVDSKNVVSDDDVEGTNEPVETVYEDLLTSTFQFDINLSPKEGSMDHWNRQLIADICYLPVILIMAIPTFMQCSISSALTAVIKILSMRTGVRGIYVSVMDRLEGITKEVECQSENREAQATKHDAVAPDMKTDMDSACLSKTGLAKEVECLLENPESQASMKNNTAAVAPERATDMGSICSESSETSGDEDVANHDQDVGKVTVTYNSDSGHSLPERFDCGKPAVLHLAEAVAPHKSPDEGGDAIDTECEASTKRSKNFALVIPGICFTQPGTITDSNPLWNESFAKAYIEPPYLSLAVLEAEGSVFCDEEEEIALMLSGYWSSSPRSTAALTPIIKDRSDQEEFTKDVDDKDMPHANSIVAVSVEGRFMVNEYSSSDPSPVRTATSDYVSVVSDPFTLSLPIGGSPKVKSSEWTQVECSLLDNPHRLVEDALSGVYETYREFFKVKHDVFCTVLREMVQRLLLMPIGFIACWRFLFWTVAYIGPAMLALLLAPHVTLVCHFQYSHGSAVFLQCTAYYLLYALVHRVLNCFGFSLKLLFNFEATGFIAPVAGVFKRVSSIRILSTKVDRHSIIFAVQGIMEKYLTSHRHRLSVYRVSVLRNLLRGMQLTRDRASFRCSPRKGNSVGKTAHIDG
jgi:hypothetical protein